MAHLAESQAEYELNDWMCRFQIGSPHNQNHLSLWAAPWALALVKDLVLVLLSCTVAARRDILNEVVKLHWDMRSQPVSGR
ncbi:unnamed protein product [Tetraodon nigroviridis]|uniref:(spotted green pufferfish) hypothetical protein n=1 Tax=Tetraodon nigroviridis TaxID=99883 RepID=Q4SGY7_TETNG|nr:unnamed protein product [Tetraodon nigroviridis]